MIDGKFFEIESQEEANIRLMACGKAIRRIILEDNMIKFQFQDGYRFLLESDADCCEQQYMTTEDDLNYFVGAVLLDMSVDDTVTVQDRDPGSDEVHEIQFLNIRTSKGAISICAHNENNGSYCGIWLRSKDWPT